MRARCKVIEDLGRAARHQDGHCVSATILAANLPVPPGRSDLALLMGASDSHRCGLPIGEQSECFV
jgi:hypothetical protein